MNPNKIHKMNILLAGPGSFPEALCPDGARRESVVARRLTAIALGSFLGRAPSAGELAGEARTKNGKPCFPAYPDFHYNISHSGDYVVLGAAGQEVGIDIQKIVSSPEQALKIAKHFFSKEEQDALLVLQSPIGAAGEIRTDTGAAPGKDASGICRLFTRFWTARESYIKLTGCGLTEAFDRFRPDLGEGLIYVTGQEAPVSYLVEYPVAEGYRMTICSYEPITDIDLRDLTRS